MSGVGAGGGGVVQKIGVGRGCMGRVTHWGEGPLS